MLCAHRQAHACSVRLITTHSHAMRNRAITHTHTHTFGRGCRCRRRNNYIVGSIRRGCLAVVWRILTCTVYVWSTVHVILPERCENAVGVNYATTVYHPNRTASALNNNGHFTNVDVYTHSMPAVADEGGRIRSRDVETQFLQNRCLYVNTLLAYASHSTYALGLLCAVDVELGDLVRFMGKL